MWVQLCCLAFIPWNEDDDYFTTTLAGGSADRSRSEGPYRWEEGPNSFQPQDPILSTAFDVGLGEDLLLADPSSYRAAGRGEDAGECCGHVWPVY